MKTLAVFNISILECHTMTGLFLQLLPLQLTAVTDIIITVLLPIQVLMLLAVDVTIIAAMLLGAVTSTVESSYNLMVHVCKKIVTHQTLTLFYWYSDSQILGTLCFELSFGFS